MAEQFTPDDWTAMRTALPDRLAAMEMDPERIEAFMATVPETYQEPALLGSIAMSGASQPEFVTYGPASSPEPLYHVFGSEALSADMQQMPGQFFTDLEQGEF